MVSVQLLAPIGSMSIVSPSKPEVVAQERRAAILTYYSPVMEFVHMAVSLPWYVVGWRHEAESLKIDMMESVEFARGVNSIPSSARLEIASTERMQIYRATLFFRVQWQGLR